jgi:hypothetical protein
MKDFIYIYCMAPFEAFISLSLLVDARIYYNNRKLEIEGR